MKEKRKKKSSISKTSARGVTSLLRVKTKERILAGDISKIGRNLLLSSTEMKMPIPKLFDLLSEIFEIKWKFLASSNTRNLGFAYFGSETIFINRSLVKSRSDALSVFFHEVCHIVSYRDKKFRSYQREFYPKTKAEKVAYLKNCLRAELYVDNMAKKMMSLIFPTVRYVERYRKKEELEAFRSDIAQTVLTHF